MTTFRGTGGDDTIDRSGDTGGDDFRLWQGGNDTVVGGAGNDIFQMGGALNADDRLDGGGGKDVVALNGDYSAGLVFSADTITNIEVMRLRGGHSYDLTMNDGNVAAGERLLVRGNSLGASDTLTFDGSAEKDGKYYIVGGAGNDVLTGGAKNDVFDLSHGGNDTADGGHGNDTFYMGAAFSSSDSIDGGAGNDTLVLNGDFSAGTTLEGTTVANIETLTLEGPTNSYNLTVAGGVTGAGLFTVDASAAAEMTLHLGNISSAAIVIGSAGDDTIVDNSSEATTITGGLGADDLDTGGPGGDTFVYTSAADSPADTKTHADTIDVFDSSIDHFHLPFIPTVIAEFIPFGSADDFSDLAVAIDRIFVPGVHDAALFKITGGALAGHSVLFVDVDNDGAYSGASDLAIDIPAFSGFLLSGNFI